jgi:hypothetical protein
VVTKSEPSKPKAATLAEASPELDAPGPLVTTVAAGAGDADAESGKTGSTTAQAPRTARGRGEPHRAAAPRTAKGTPSQKAVAREAHSRLEPGLSEASPSVVGAPDAWRVSSADASLAATEESGPHDAPSEDEDFGHPPSRLSGLRNMLVSLGRRSLLEDEYGVEEADTEPRFERATVRPAYHEPPTTETESGGSAPVRVTAPPEFIRPQPAAEAEKEKEPLRPTPPVARRERESPDEIQTLPSWRGQYRKKRYPPI